MCLCALTGEQTVVLHITLRIARTLPYAESWDSLACAPRGAKPGIPAVTHQASRGGTRIAEQDSSIRSWSGKLIATRFTFIERCKLHPFSEDCLQHPSRL